MQLASLQRRPVGTLGTADHVLRHVRRGRGDQDQDLRQRRDRRARVRPAGGRHRAAGVQRPGVREVVRVVRVRSLRRHLRLERQGEWFIIKSV